MMQCMSLELEFKSYKYLNKIYSKMFFYGKGLAKY